jgi:predicted transcriptional regulator
MTIMTIRIPDDVKEALDKAFQGEDKDAIIAQIIRDGLAARSVREMVAARDEGLAERRRKAVDSILELRKTMPAISQDEIRAIREEMRK